MYMYISIGDRGDKYEVCHHYHHNNYGFNDNDDGNKDRSNHNDDE